jgi:hypothetical protein
MSTRDWTAIVRRRLHDAGGPAPADDVVEEIAEHLAERYEDAVNAGIDVDAARAAAVAELDDVRASAWAARAPRGPSRHPSAASADSGEASHVDGYRG